MQPVLTFRWNARLSLGSLLPFPRVKSSLPPIGVSTVLSRLRPSCWQLHDGVHARAAFGHVMVSLLSDLEAKTLFQLLVCTELADSSRADPKICTDGGGITLGFQDQTTAGRTSTRYTRW